MKLEPRGKYAGVKVHLDGEECGEIISIPPGAKDEMLSFYISLRKHILKLQKVRPDLLKDRTPAQVEAELKEEAAKATMKLAKAGVAGEWNKVGEDCEVVILPGDPGKVQVFWRKSFAEYESMNEFLAFHPLPASRVRVRAIEVTK